MNSEVNTMKSATSCGKTIMAGMALALFLGGCATPTSEDDFGNSVRRMIEAQKHVPEEQPPQLPSLDGARAEASVTQYRKEVGAPERIETNVGFGSSQ